MKLSNPHHQLIRETNVFIVVDGKRYLVRLITKNRDEANEFMGQHSETAHIDDDDEGFIYVANILDTPTTCGNCGTPPVIIKGAGVCPKEFGEYVKKNG